MKRAVLVVLRDEPQLGVSRRHVQPLLRRDEPQDLGLQRHLAAEARVRTRCEHTDRVITEFLFSDFAPNDFLPRVRLSMFSFCDFCAKRLFPCPVAGSCYASGSACFRCAVTCGALLSMFLLRNFFQTVLAVFLRRTVPATCHARHVRTV